jgi:hypothetical protein
LLRYCHAAVNLVLRRTRQLKELDRCVQELFDIRIVSQNRLFACSPASIAAFVASGEMAVAYFRAHAPIGFWPIQNGGGWAFPYCFFFLYVAAKGSGRFSLDSLIDRCRATLAPAAATGNTGAWSASRDQGARNCFDGTFTRYSEGDSVYLCLRFTIDSSPATPPFLKWIITVPESRWLLRKSHSTPNNSLGILISVPSGDVIR